MFDFSLYTENSSSLTVDAVSIPTQTMQYSGSGVITDGNVIAVDLDLGLGNTSTSGCEVADLRRPDWSGSDDIALIQRGACAFGTKAINATAAGAEGVIIFNQGNTADPGRQDIIGGTLGEGAIGSASRCSTSPTATGSSSSTGQPSTWRPTPRSSRTRPRT